MEVLYRIHSLDGRKRLIATKDIAKSTLIRNIVPGVGTVPISGQKHLIPMLVSLESEAEKIDLLHNCFDINGMLHEIIDDSQYIRHESSEKSNIARSKGRRSIIHIPNPYIRKLYLYVHYKILKLIIFLIDKDKLISFATKDIKAGEEIVEDNEAYRWPSWLAKLSRSSNFKISRFYQKLAPGVASMQIKYQVKKGKYGMGVFVDEDVPRGTLIWKYNQDVNVKVICNSWEGESALRQYLTTFSSYQQKQDLLIHMYCEHGFCHQLLDDCQFWNHSDDPNTGCDGPDPFNAYALRDIKKGEELLDDYGTYEWPDWYLNLLVEYGVDVDYFTVHDKSRNKNFDRNLRFPVECN